MTLSKAANALNQYCKDHKIRVSAPRAHVLDIILAAPKPMTAYEVLDALGAHLDSPKPPTAYRALEFLSQHGFIHRIESLNAYIACSENHRHAGSQFMICDECGRVDEAHLCSVPASLEKQAANAGFKTQRWSVELHGVCRDCA
jgi:Fur family zinc uptake transcriptional regulator